MGVKSVSSDRESWDKIFETLVKILHTKQDEVESLLKDRKIIEDRLKTKHQNWISDVRDYEEQLSLMNRETETMKMMQLVETSKFSLLSGLKESDRSLCKLKLEQTVDELNDFKAWFDFLTLNNTNVLMQKESGDLEAADNESLEAKVIKLKLEYEKLASEKKCEVSDLLRENGFAWSQFKCTESGFTDKLKKKDDEIAQANTKIASLLSYQEQLQSTNQDKDDIISRLKAKVAEMETNSTKKDEEILKLSREIESLKKSRSFTPVLTRCTTTLDKGSNGNTHISTKKEKSAASTPNDKDIKSSKRKRVNKTPVSISEVPKLFTSTFRVPKLKSPSSEAI
uniref:Cytomatrix protein-related n=2 Tax=Noccaea caerulescens TaxID=107243 RepID=A0A1J3D9K2_NOCCA